MSEREDLQFVRFTFGGIKLELNPDEADDLSDWLNESAATAKTLARKIHDAVTKPKPVDLSPEERAVLLGTKLRDEPADGRSGLARLMVALKSAEIKRGELEEDDAS